LSFLFPSGATSSFCASSGHRRLRPDPWLYSIFLPIEAGLLTQEQALQALHYTEWGLQRDRVLCADGSDCGDRVWTSKYVMIINFFKTRIEQRKIACAQMRSISALCFQSFFVTALFEVDLFTSLLQLSLPLA
jgi:hypothetical protein